MKLRVTKLKNKIVQVSAIVDPDKKSWQSDRIILFGLDTSGKVYYVNPVMNINGSNTWKYINIKFPAEREYLNLEEVIK